MEIGQRKSSQRYDRNRHHGYQQLRHREDERHDGGARSGDG